MITDIFDMVDKKPVPTIHCQLIPEFKNIIDKYPKRYVDMLAYSYYKACPFKSVNPYASYSEDEREEKLKKDFVIFPDNEDVLMAVDKMKELYETTGFKFYRKCKKNLDDIMDSIDESPVIYGKDGNMGERLRIAEKCFILKSQFDQLEENIETERKMRNKSDRSLGRGELG